MEVKTILLDFQLNSNNQIGAFETEVISCIQHKINDKSLKLLCKSKVSTVHIKTNNRKYTLK
jgi:hypothetical protein